MDFSSGSDGKESACSAGDLGQSLGWEDPLEEGMATHSSILAWRIAWTEEPGGLQSMGLQRVGHDWATNNFTFTFILNYRLVNSMRNVNSSMFFCSFPLYYKDTHSCIKPLSFGTYQVLRDIESIDSKMLFLMELRNLVGKTYNTHKNKEMCKVCEDHDNSYARNKSGCILRDAGLIG